jgi:hypothetical protein
MVPQPAQLNSKSIARYRGSAPINFRLILVNSLVLAGCTYVLVTALNRYNTALSDLDHVSKTSVIGAKPCGMAVPNLKYLFQSLKELGDGAFAEDQEKQYVERARGALCGTNSINNAIRSALQATEIEDDCCSAYPTTDERYKSPQQLEESVKAYVCACTTETCTNGHGMGDMVRRIQHAYVLAAPAFAVYVDSNNGGNTCASPNDPFSSASCATSDASIRQAITGELSIAAENAFQILAGKSTTDAPWPTTTEMLYRLIALSIIEYYDRKSNSGGCFANMGASQTEAVQFCVNKLQASVGLAGASVTRPLGDPWPGGCANAAEHVYYTERITNSDSCTYTAATDTASAKTPVWTQRPRKFSTDYAESGTLPVYAVCSSMLEFGLLDRKRLFGLPDPVGEYEWYAEHSGWSFTRWLAGIGYWGMFDANKDKSEVADKHTAYLDLKLYVAYRYAATSAWVLAALIACGYLLAFSAVPFAKLIYVRLVRRNLTNTRTDTILLKPTGTAETIALLTTVVVGLWVIFVDPAGATPYIVTTTCDDYAAHGGPYPTTSQRPRDGLLGLVLLLLGTGLFLYTVTCRRPPKRQRIMPLDPFPIWPILVLILAVLIAVLLLMIRAGDTWWDRESTKLDGSNTKTTQDFEDVIGAVLWVLLCLGLLMGVLNQRHMAANVVLNVPRGRPVVFAYLWVGVAFAAAIVAAVFAWPLFDCQVAWTTNELICGDGTDLQIQWNYFFGGVAFLACIVAILFVFWASFKVLFSVPRKDDPASTAFNRSKDQEVALLAAKKSGTSVPTLSTNPFGTGLSAGTASTANITAAVVGDDSLSDDDYDVYGAPDEAAESAVDLSATTTTNLIERLKFDLSGACTKERGNVLSEARLLPAIGVPVVSASFVRQDRSEVAPLLPQHAPVQRGGGNYKYTD